MLNVKKWRQFISAKLLIASMILGGAAMNASGAWGDLDMSFGTSGKYQETATGYQVGDVVMQPDGKILVTGSKLNSSGKKRFFLRRYLANGMPDTSFGNNGSAVINVMLNSAYDYGGIKVRMLTANKIIVLGSSNGNIAVWVINSDGYGNADFGTNGYKVLSNYKSLSTHLGSISGKPIIGLYEESSQRVIIIKLNIDGTQDMTFGTNGLSNTNIYGTTTQVPWFQMITEADTNKITIAGLPLNSNPPPIRLERKLSNGATDFTFAPSGNGLAQFQHSSFSGLGKLSSGKYVYCFMDPDFSSNLPSYLSRTSSSGVLEERISSGANGKLIGVQPDGKIVVEAGYFMTRYDEYFNGQGIFQLYPQIDYLQSRRYTFQADNKMVVAGIEEGKLTLVRLLAN